MIITLPAKGKLLYKLPYFKLLSNNIWIAGGAVRDSMMNKKFNDIDIFGTNIKELQHFIEFSFPKTEWDNIYNSPNKLLTYKHKTEDIKVQVVFQCFPSIEDCLNSFDFTVCQFAFDGHHIHLSEMALIHEHYKELHPVESGVSSVLIPKTIKRLEKYVKYGYTITSDLIEYLVRQSRDMSEHEIEESLAILKSFEEGAYEEWNID